MDAPPVALVSLLTTDRRLIYRPVQHLTSCQSGVWRAGAGKPKLTPYTYTNYSSSYNYMNIGYHDFCTSQYGNENDRDDSWRGVQSVSDGSWQIVVKDGSETAMCLDW